MERAVRRREEATLASLSSPAPRPSEYSYFSSLKKYTPRAVEALGTALSRLASNIVSQWTPAEGAANEAGPSQPAQGPPLCSDSPALLRLPPEIRILIWRYTVGDRFIFAPSSQRHGRRGHYPDKWPEDAHIPKRKIIGAENTPVHLHSDLDLFKLQTQLAEPRYSWCSKKFSSRRTRNRKEPYCVTAQCSWSGLALVLVCKFIHAEALPVLMGYNTFHFWTAHDFALFRSQLGSARLARIRYLQLELVPVVDDVLTISILFGCVVDRFQRPLAMLGPRTWTALWACIVADMPVLRELDVTIGFFERDLATFRASWLDDLRGLRGRLRRVQLFVACPENPWELRPPPRTGINYSDWRMREPLDIIRAKVLEMEAFLLNKNTLEDNADKPTDTEETTLCRES